MQTAMLGVAGLVVCLFVVLLVLIVRPFDRFAGFSAQATRTSPPVMAVEPTRMPAETLAPATPTLVETIPPAAPAPTNTLLATPIPMNTLTLAPTATLAPAVATSTPVITDTLAGKTLAVGETWQQNGMTMTAGNPTFNTGCPNTLLALDVAIKNNSGGELVVNLAGKDWSLSDDQGKLYAANFRAGERNAACDGFLPLNALSKYAMSAGESYTFTLMVTGTPNDAVTQYVLTVIKAGRISNARWVIPVPK